MAKLNEGDVEITLNEQTIVLRPTLRAMNAISSMGGLGKVRQALVDQDFSTVVSVILHGANLAGSRQAKELPDAVYHNGMDAALLVPLLNYVAILANGGKPLPEPGETDDDEQKALSAEGNGS